MSNLAYYLNATAGDIDPAINKALKESHYSIHEMHSIPDFLDSCKTRARTDDGVSGDCTLLVAEVQAGAISLLTLMHEKGYDPLPTLLFDRDENNITSAILALQLGASDYVLASEEFSQRELRARILAERIKLARHQHPDDKAVSNSLPPLAPQEVQQQPLRDFVDFEWLPEVNVIRCHGAHVQLSPVQGRIFALLVASLRQTVTIKALIACALTNPTLNTDEGARLLHPHIKHLRERLCELPRFGHHIVTVRNQGYLLV